ncbi:ATP-binding protein [Ruficoccus amylovorans]|uniref:ATP-binding protein n=1 Tax=Ruficoccus amylovorans TaxID=1804625 RepID=A0A842HDP3_9BACT|nr:ATP-binding protein [Ruficoccus amylovorans]MBC2594339.1 ATP-binding protein [Ruficoccus amylovorans]
MNTLRHYLEAGQNVVLYGERRIGKTSLVSEAVRGLKGFRSLFIDIYEVQSLHSLCQRIASAVSRKGNQKLLQAFIQSITSLRPTLTLNTEGAPVIGLDAQAVKTPSGLEPILDFLCSDYSSPETVVVFDEFQSILNLPDSREVQAIMRGKIQQQSGAFVFLGSIRQEMRLLFTDYESPFKDSAVLMEVGYLPWDKFQRFLEKKFAESDFTVDEAVWPVIFDITRGHPNETQKLCSALWMGNMDTHRVTLDNLREGYELIFAMQRAQFERDWASLTGIQQRVLRTVARVGGKQLTGKDFLRASDVAHGPTVLRALDRLNDLEILIERDGEQCFTDPFFRLWLLEKGY